MGVMCNWFGVGCTNLEDGSRQAVVIDNVRYTKSEDSGWLMVLGKSGVKTTDICEYTKVTLLQEKNGRTYFKIETGPRKGWEVSLKKENAAKYLNKTPPEPTAAELIVTYQGREKDWYSPVKGKSYEQQWAEISFNGDTARVTLNSIWDNSYTPIPVGVYRILVPDNPHLSMTEGYRRAEPGLKYDTVWFPIEHGDNSRYVHVGNVSTGCVTNTTLGKWNALYKYLISHRPDGTSVGTLTVQLA